MSQNDIFALKGITDIKSQTIGNEIQDNLIEFFDWSLLNIGNYFNVTIGELSPDGIDYSRLSPVKDRVFQPGEAWQGFRKNWVWQTSITYTPAPITTGNPAQPGIPGVYINDIFYDQNTVGEFAYKVDYHNGLVIFNTPISVISKVQAEYSYKYINMTYPSSVPWLQEIQSNSLEPTDGFLANEGTPWSKPVFNRVQLPMVAVELVANRRFKGFQLGGGQIANTGVIFHCIAEDEPTRNKIIDIFSLQNEKTIYLFNSNQIIDSDDFPISQNGSPISNAKDYKQLVTNYPYLKIRMTDCSVNKMEILNSSLYGGVIGMSIEVILLDI